MNLGKEGEDFACDYLVKRGFYIVGRNIREKFGEIDIAAKRPDGTLAFVEVKALKYWPDGLMPEDHLSHAKLSKLRKICEAFANAHPELVREKRGWQIDLLALTAGDNGFGARYYENIA